MNCEQVFCFLWFSRKKHLTISIICNIIQWLGGQPPNIIIIIIISPFPLSYIKYYFVFLVSNVNKSTFYFYLIILYTNNEMKVLVWF